MMISFLDLNTHYAFLLFSALMFYMFTVISGCIGTNVMVNRMDGMDMDDFDARMSSMNERMERMERRIEELTCQCDEDDKDDEISVRKN